MQPCFIPRKRGLIETTFFFFIALIVDDEIPLQNSVRPLNMILLRVRLKFYAMLKKSFVFFFKTRSSIDERFKIIILSKNSNPSSCSHVIPLSRNSDCSTRNKLDVDPSRNFQKRFSRPNTIGNISNETTKLVCHSVADISVACSYIPRSLRSRYGHIRLIGSAGTRLFPRLLDLHQGKFSIGCP